MDVYTQIDSDIITSTLTNKINDKTNIIDVYRQSQMNTDVYTKSQNDATLPSNTTTRNNATGITANSTYIY